MMAAATNLLHIEISTVRTAHNIKITLIGNNQWKLYLLISIFEGPAGMIRYIDIGDSIRYFSIYRPSSTTINVITGVRCHGIQNTHALRDVSMSTRATRAVYVSP
jgi:hypothetical protein